MKIKKKTFFLIPTLISLLSCKNTESASAQNINSEKSIYEYKAKTITGAEFDFAQLKGKKVLIVNTASECGYTPQYKDLQALHEKYGDKITVIGFPCNQFGGQEPGSASDIQTFCKKNYGVTFQMMEKINVKSSDKAPIYKYLTEKEMNGWNNNAPSWNFCKFLIDENGHVIRYFNSNVKPMDKEITQYLIK